MDRPPPLSVEEFHAACARHLTRRDLGVMIACLNGQANAHPFLEAWGEIETQLRNAIARRRAARWRTDVRPYIKPHGRWDVEVERVVAEAYARSSPLERERVLDQFRWRRAEALASGCPFSLERLLAYALHLRLAVRWASMSTERGRDAADRWVEEAVRSAAATVRQKIYVRVG